MDWDKVLRTIHRFTDRRSPTECWPWLGWSSRGYACVKVDGRNYRVARVLVALRDEVDLADHSWVARHGCDTPLCVNAAHLQHGTQGDNQRDAHQRKRRVSPFARLTRLQVLSIRRSTDSTADLAARFGVHRETVRRIRTGKTWPHA